MKNFLLILAFASLLSACCVQKPQNPGTVAVPIKNMPQPPLEEVVGAIQTQYEAAIKELEKQNIKNVEIESADISLKVSREISGTGEFKVLIIKPSASYTNSHSTTVTYSLVKKPSVGGNNKLAKDDRLKDLIVASAKNFNDLRGTIGPLTKDSFGLDIVFSVKWEAGIGIEFDLWGIGADLSGATGKEIEHEMSLKFKFKDIK